jgi:hypothetical protein
MSLMNLGMRLDSQSRITIELLDAEDDLGALAEFPSLPLLPATKSAFTDSPW